MRRNFLTGAGNNPPALMHETLHGGVANALAGAGQNDLRPVNGIKRLAVVMGDAEVQSLDTVEIAGIDFMLASHLVGFRPAQKLPHGGHRALQHIDAAHLDVGAARHQLVAQPLIGQGEEYNSRHNGNMIQGAGQLCLGPYKGIGMDHDIDIVELCQGRIGHGMQGFAGGIRNQMDMKLMIHRSYPTLRPGCVLPGVKAQTSHKLLAGKPHYVQTGMVWGRLTQPPTHYAAPARLRQFLQVLESMPAFA